MRDIIDRQPDKPADPHVVALNYTIVALVDELLWLPSLAVATAAVHLLYGPDTSLPDALRSQAGKGAPLSVVSLLAAGTPLGTLLPTRLGSSGAWRAGTARLREARVISRDRYCQLQTAFVSGAARGMTATTGSLVRDVYGVGGRRSCADGARRVLLRVVRLNRAALALLAAVARGECWTRLDARGPLPARPYDLPGADLDVLAEALPPIVIPDFAGLAAGLTPAEFVFCGEESTDRYQSLFAEMLSLSGHPETCS
jgi:hypothetical protein